MSAKDFKLLIRNPQRLATFIAYTAMFAMPFLIAFIQLPAGMPPDIISSPLRMLISVIPAMGVLFGASSEQFFYIEGEGARDLYRLPVTKKSIALSKTLSSFLALLPVGLVLFVIASYFLGISWGAGTAVLLEINVAASLLINSSVSVASLPKEASAWSERSASTSLASIRVLLLIGGIVLGGFFALIAILTPIGEVAMVGLSAVLVAIAAVMYQRLRDAPLTE